MTYVGLGGQGQTGARRTIGGYPVNEYGGGKPGTLYEMSPRGYVKVSPKDAKAGADETFTFGGVVVPVNRGNGKYVGVSGGENIGVQTNRGTVGLQSIITSGSSALNQYVAANTWTALDEWKQRDSRDVTQLQKSLAKRGLIGKQSVTGNWNPSTEKAMTALMYVGNRTGRPWDTVLMGAGDGDVSGGGGSGGGGGGGGGADPVPYTVTNTDIVRNTRKTAVSAIKDVMQAELGRAPTPSEVSDFIKGLREYESENPRVTTTTVTPKQIANGDWVNEQSTVVEGGVDSTEMQAYLQDFGDDYRPKEERRYKRGQYLDMLMGMIEEGV